MTTILRHGEAEFLASPLLAGIAEGSRRAAFLSMTPARLTSGTPLLSQGVTNDRLWFVLEGSVEVERRHSDGRVEVMATLSGPAIFGTTTFFRATPPSATIRASTDLTLWTLDHPGYETLRREHPRAAEALALTVVRVLSERFDLLDARLAELMIEHGEDHPRATEWGEFRSRLFEDA